MHVDLPAVTSIPALQQPSSASQRPLPGFSASITLKDVGSFAPKPNATGVANSEFVWDKKWNPFSGLKISDDGLRVTASNSMYPIKADTGWEEGKHIWKIHQVANNPNNPSSPPFIFL